MASATTATSPSVFASPLVTVTRVTFSSSYTTGGESLSAKQLGLGTVFVAIATCVTAGAAGVVEAWYNQAAGKLVAFGATGEIANATNLSTVAVEVVSFGQAY